MVGYPLINTLSEFGSVSRGICIVSDQNKLESVNELTCIQKIENEIVNEDEFQKRQVLSGDEVVSMNMWGFTPQLFSQLEKLFSDFLSENIDNLSSEFTAVTKNKKRTEKRCILKNKFLIITNI